MSYYSALNTNPPNVLTDYGGTCQDNLYFTLQHDNKGGKTKCAGTYLLLHTARKESSYVTKNKTNQ